MILYFNQWIKLQDNVTEAKEWFSKVGLFKDGYMGTLDKISLSTRHELSQIRKWEDWDTFCADIPEDKRLPLNMIINFANMRYSMDWPLGYDDHKKLITEFRENIGGTEDWKKKWNIRHNLFGTDRVQTTYLHYDPTLYGGVVLVCEKNSYKNSDMESKYGDGGKERWGIVINEHHYVPISVEF